MSYGVDRRRSLDSELLRLCCKPAAAALIGTLAWELPYASGAALKKKKKKKNPSSQVILRQVLDTGWRGGMSLRTEWDPRDLPAPCAPGFLRGLVPGFLPSVPVERDLEHSSLA